MTSRHDLTLVQVESVLIHLHWGGLAWSMTGRPFDASQLGRYLMVLHWAGLTWFVTNRPCDSV